MKKFKVEITNGKSTDSFILPGKSHSEVKELCDIVHLGTGWKVNKVTVARKVILN